MMRFLIPFIILLLLDIYVFQVVASAARDFGRLQKMLVYIVFWLTPVIAFLIMYSAGRGYFALWPKYISSMAMAFMFIVYFSKVFAAIPLIVDDVRRFFVLVAGKIFPSTNFDAGRSDFISKFALLLGGLPFGLLSYGVLRNPYRYKLRHQDIYLRNLPDELDGFKIVQISDIHSGSFFMKEPVKSSVAMINTCKPDIVFFTGDLVNNKADEIDDFIDVFDKIEAKYGVYSILGNHDYGDYHHWDSAEQKHENFRKMIDAHKRLGWKLLMNENEKISLGNATLGIIGVENYSMAMHFPKYGDLAKAYKGVEDADVKILLSHDPTHWDGQVIKDYKDIALTLSGHTHGFQFGVEIPGWIKWSPSQFVYKRWAGLYTQHDQYLYVNRGLGFLAYPGRVGILPEVTELVLKKML